MSSGIPFAEVGTSWAEVLRFERTHGRWRKFAPATVNPIVKIGLYLIDSARDNLSVLHRRAEAEPACLDVFRRDCTFFGAAFSPGGMIFRCWNFRPISSGVFLSRWGALSRVGSLGRDPSLAGENASLRDDAAVVAAACDLTNVVSLMPVRFGIARWFRFRSSRFPSRYGRARLSPWKVE